MSRKNRDYSREKQPDPIYGSVLLSNFINKMMIRGKKSVAQKIVYGAINILGEKVKELPLSAFEKALQNAIPLMEVRSRRVGGSTYQVPVEVRPVRGKALGMRWLIQYARARSGKTMIEKLAAELQDSYNRVGSTMKKREDTHKMADSNKAFAHFRW
jgi:small subunit ribosomal protein S7